MSLVAHVMNIAIYRVKADVSCRSCYEHTRREGTYSIAIYRVKADVSCSSCYEHSHI